MVADAVRLARGALVLALVSHAPQLVAQTILRCEGVVSSSSEAQPLARSRQTISIEVSADASQMRITGYWGCAVEMARDAGRDRAICSGALDLTNSGNQSTWARDFSGKGYSGFSSLTVDRVTGTLTAGSMVYANETSGANWKLMSIDASFECKTAPRLF